MSKIVATSSRLPALLLFLASVGLVWIVVRQDVSWGPACMVTAGSLLLLRLRGQRRPAGAVADRPVTEPTAELWRQSRVWQTLRGAPRALVHQVSLRLELLVFVLIAGAIFYQILVPPVAGLADNGDFGRIMAQTGLAYESRGSGADSGSISLHFLVDKPHFLAAGYASSELIFVKAGLLLDGLVSQAGTFDLRALGILHAAAFLAGLALALVATRTLPQPSRWISAILMLLVFTDVGYVAYLNSLYREPAAMVFLTLSGGCALLYIRARKPSLELLLAYFVAAALFVAAKPQYAPQAILLAVFGMLLSRRWSWKSYRRWVSVGMAAMLCAVGAWSYTAQPDSLSRATLYNLVFSDLLVHSPTPKAELVALGLDPALAKWTGTDAFDSSAPIKDPAFEEDFFSHVTPATLAEFYATHPERMMGLLNRAALQGIALQPAQGDHDSAFAAWSNLRELLPLGSLAGLAFILATAASAGVLVRRRCGRLQDKLLAELFLFLVAMAAVQFVVVCLGGGTLDIVKHLFAFNLLLDMAVIMGVSYAAKWWSDVVS